MKYSIIFLCYDPENKKDFVGASLRSAIENASGDYELVPVLNVKGYVHAVNNGLSRAKGEFMFIMNDDVVIEEKDWMGKLAKPGAITSWRSNEFFLSKTQMPDGALYCIPRTVYEQLGGLDPIYGEGYGFDEIDYFFRAEEKGVPLVTKPIQLSHGENKTYQAYFSDLKENMTSRNHSLFYQKWKEKLPHA